MSTEVENRIVNLEFNNKDFEKHAAQSMQTVDTLKKKLDFSGVKTGFEGIINAAKFLGSGFKGAINGATNLARGLSNISSAALHPIRNIEQLTGTVGVAEKSFSMLEEISIGALRRLGEQAVQTGEQLVKSLTVDQVAAGWEKFGEKTRSVASIMSATGYSADEVAEKLKKLNWYTDETSYAYTDMTNNISKFTNAGIDLDEAITAMIGIGNAAGLAGSSVQDASHAMEGFSGAMAQGYMDRQRWSWIKTAHMDTVQFKEALIQAGEELGTLQRGADGVWGAFGYFDDDSMVTVDNFENAMTKAKWLTRDVMTKALMQYGGTTEKLYEFIQEYNATHDDTIYTSEAIEQLGVSAEDLGLKAFKASQEARTFADAIDSVKDAVSTGFMTAIEHLIGNYERAKKLWTDLANNLWDVFADPIDQLNSALDNWEGLGGQDLLNNSLYKFMDTIAEYIWAFKDAVTEVFGVLDADRLMSITEYIDKIATAFEDTVDNGTMDAIVSVWKEFLTIIKTVFDVAMDVKDVLVDGFEYASGVFETVSDSVKEVADVIEEVVDTVEEATEDLSKAYQAVYDIYMKNSLGTDQKRKELLKGMGLDPDFVQSWVNKMFDGTYDNLDDLKKDMLGVADDLKDAGDDVAESLTDNVSDVVDEVSKGSRDAEKVYDAIEQIWNKASLGTGAERQANLEAMGLDAEYVQDYINKFTAGLRTGQYKSLSDLKEELIANAGEVSTEVVEDIEEVEEAAVEVTTPIGKAMNKLRELLSAVGDGFKKAFEFANEDGQLFSIALGVKTVVDIFKTAFSSLVDSFKRTNALKNLVQAVVNPFANIGSLLHDKVNLSRISAIVTDISYAFTALTNVVKLLSDAFSEAFVDTFLKIDVTKTISDKIVWITNFFNNIYKTFKDNDRLTRITKGLASAIRLVSKVIDKVIGAIKPGVKKIFPELVEFIATLADLITDVADNDDVIAAIAKNVMTAVDHTATKITILINVIKTLIVVAAKVIDYIVRLAAALIDKFSGSTAFSRVVESFKRLGDAISNLFGKNKEGLSETVDELGKTGEEASSSFDWLDGVVVIIDTIATAISGLVDGIANVITWIDEFIDKIQNGGSGITADIDSGNAKSSVFGAIGYGLSHIFDTVDLDAVSKGAGVMGASIFGALGSSVGEFFENANIDTKEVMILGRFIGLLLALIELNKLMTTANTFTKTLAQFPLKSTGLSWIIDLKNILGGITGVLTQTKNSIKKLTEMNMLQTFVYSLIGVALTVALLAEIPEGKLAKGVTYLGIIATIIAFFAKFMAKLTPSLTEINLMTSGDKTFKRTNIFSNNKANINAGPVGIAAVLTSLAAFALAISGALWIISKLDWNNGTADKAVKVMLGMFAMLALLIVAISEFGKSLKQETAIDTKWGRSVKSGPGGYFASVAAFMMSLVGVIAIITGAIFALGWAANKYGVGNLLAGAAIVGGILVVLMIIMGVISAAIKKFGGSTYENLNSKTVVDPIENVGGTLIAFAVAMVIVAAAVDALIPMIVVLAGLLHGKTFGGIAAIVGSFIVIAGALLGMFAAMVGLFKEFKTNNASIGEFLGFVAGLAIIAVAIDLLIPAIVAFGALEGLVAPSASLMVAGAIGVILLAMAGVVAIIIKMANSIKSVDIMQKVSAIATAFAALGLCFAAIAISMGVMIKMVHEAGDNWWAAAGFIFEIMGLLTLVSLGVALLLTIMSNNDKMEERKMRSFTESIIMLMGSIALIFVAIAVSMSIMQKNAVDIEQATVMMLEITGTITLLLLAIAAVFAILYFVAPGSDKVVASALQSIALIMLAYAAVLFSVSVSFALGAYLFSKALETINNILPDLSKALPGFGDALADFCDRVAPYVGTLIGVAVSIGILIVACASAIGILMAAFAGIIWLYNQFDDDTKKSMRKVTRTVASVLIAMGAAVYAATPEMLQFFEDAMWLVVNRLSAIIPDIADALLMFLLMTLDGLATAIGHNTRAILYYASKIVIALASAIAQMGDEIRQATDNLDEMILTSIFGEDVAAVIHYAGRIAAAVNPLTAPVGIPALIQWTAEGGVEGEQWDESDWDKYRQDAYDGLADVLEFDESEIKQRGSKGVFGGLLQTTMFGDPEDESDALSDINTKASAYTAAAFDGVTNAAADWYNKHKGELGSLSLGGEKIDVSKLIDQFTQGEMTGTTFSEYLNLNLLLGTDVQTGDMSWDEIQNYAKSVGADLSGISYNMDDASLMFSDYESQLQSFMGANSSYFSDLNRDLIENNAAFDSWSSTTSSYLDSVDATSEEALAGADNTLGGMLDTMSLYSERFYDSGEMLIVSVKQGMLDAFEGLHKAFINNMAEILKDVSYVYTGDELGTTEAQRAAKRAYEVVHKDELLKEKSVARSNAMAESEKARSVNWEARQEEYIKSGQAYADAYEAAVKARIEARKIESGQAYAEGYEAAVRARTEAKQEQRKEDFESMSLVAYNIAEAMKNSSNEQNKTASSLQPVTEYGYPFDTQVLTQKAIDLTTLLGDGNSTSAQLAADVATAKSELPKAINASKYDDTNVLNEMTLLRGEIEGLRTVMSNQGVFIDGKLVGQCVAPEVNKQLGLMQIRAMRGAGK